MDGTPSERYFSRDTRETTRDVLTVAVHQWAETTPATAAHPSPDVVHRRVDWRLRRLLTGGMRVMASGVRGGRPGVRAVGWVVSRPDASGVD